jgi:hypothetical protein
VKAYTTYIDDRSTHDLHSSHAGEWSLLTDGVIGGCSYGELTADQYLGRECLRLKGDVCTNHNGGYLQMALDLANDVVFDASDYDGVVIRVAGNGERYNVHLHTSELWLPVASYRVEFIPGPDWRSIYIPFTAFKAHKTYSRLNPARLTRVAIVAIDRDFDANICVSEVALYRNAE